MRTSSIDSVRRRKGKSSESRFQASLSRYLRAFAKARAMRFWRPRLLTRAIGATALWGALAIGASASYGQFPAVFELSSLDGTNGFQINGIDSIDQSGQSVSGAGDVNGDGIDDLIIGGYGDNYAGESYVVFGSNGGFSQSLNLSSLDGTNGFPIIGGRVVSGAGDVNGDGIDDLIIGSRGGSSYVVFGSNVGFAASVDLGSLNGANGFVLNGIDSGGFSVSGAGDVNGDGIDDLIIGAPSADPNGEDNAGESYVVFGSNGGFLSSFNLRNLNGTNGFVINGIDFNDSSGGSVSGTGDVNGDGIDDLIIGAPGGDSTGMFRAGESYVVFGSNGGFSSSLNLSDLDGTNGFVLNGIDDDDVSGRVVSGAGDVNGDGIDDMIIGAYYADPNGNSRAGESYVVFGNNGGVSPSLNLSSLDGSNGFVINGIDANDWSGLSVSGAGDVNGDGIDDLIIGALLADPNGNSGAGESYVVFGSDGGFSPSLNLSSLDGANGFQINGIDEFDSSGQSVSGTGDVNGDGIDDFLIGASSADPNGNVAAGESYVVFGRALSALKGDIDLDGDVDFLDIGPLIGVLASGGFQAEADIDCNSVVDFLDIAPFIALLQGP